VVIRWKHRCMFLSPLKWAAAFRLLWYQGLRMGLPSGARDRGLCFVELAELFPTGQFGVESQYGSLFNRHLNVDLRENEE